MYGTTVVGSKGQIVIPVEARKDLKLKSGDRLLVMGKFNKALGLIKAEDLEGLIKTIMDNIAEPNLKKEIKQRAEQLFKSIK